MADRYPLVVASNTVQEIVANDNLNLSEVGIVSATTVKFADTNYYVGQTGIGGSVGITSENADAPALIVSGIGSIGINTTRTSAMMQIGGSRRYMGVIGVNTTALNGASYVEEEVDNTASIKTIYQSGVAAAIASGIATVKTDRYMEIGPALVMVDVDKFGGEYKGGALSPDTQGIVGSYPSDQGKQASYDPTPIGISSRGVYVGLGVTDPQVRLDVNGEILVRQQNILFSMDRRNNTNYDYIRSDDRNVKRPGRFFFCHDQPRNSDVGSSVLVAGAVQLSSLGGTQAHPSTFPQSVGVGTTAPNTWVGMAATSQRYLHLVGHFKYDARPSAASVTTLGVDASGIVRESSSSRRFKENITSYEKGLADVANLNPVTFNYIGEEGTTLAGLIAEEVDEAGLGEYVVREEDGAPKAINYGHMMALMTNAIKELKAENDALKARLDAAGL